MHTQIVQPRPTKERGRRTANLWGVPATREVDVLVYGATPAGIAAAIAAAQAGRSVALLEPGAHLGGMLTGGLSRTDIGKPETVGGFFREFQRRVHAHYLGAYGEGTPQERASRGGMHFEPRVAREVLEGWVAETEGVTLERNAVISEWRMTCPERSRGVNGELTEAVSGETVWRARVWVDASYEGDLLAAAGCQFRVGRESRAEFDEEYAGLLYWDPDRTQPADGTTGEGDARVQAYCYRLCLTADPRIRVPFPQPATYDPTTYDLLLQYLRAKPNARLQDVVLLAELPNEKYDCNNWGFCWQSMDWIEGNTAYPTAPPAERARIAAAHRDYQLGWWKFVQTDPRVPPRLQTAAGAFGLCRDEFADTGHWPPQLYVRETRRLVGDDLFTQHNAQRDRERADGVAVGSYPLDSHATQWYRPDQATPWAEGFLMASVKPYDIPFGVMTTPAAPNLLVPVCVSATHVGYGTLRLEPVLTNLGWAAGTAAALALEQGVAPRSVDVAQLRERLRTSGQIVSVSEM